MKVTRFVDEDKQPYSLEQPVYGIVSHWAFKLFPGELNVDLLIYPSDVADRVDNYGERNWTLIPDEDEWELVHARDVPDEVWVALAKRELLQ